jgi:hypothetical protein
MVFLSEPPEGRDVDDSHVDDDRPLRSRRRLMAMRVLGLVGLGGLVLPGVLVTVSVASRTADRACAIYVSRDAIRATAPDARFEVGGTNGLGWNCYAQQFDGSDVLVEEMGPIPAMPALVGR